MEKGSEQYRNGLVGDYPQEAKDALVAINSLHNRQPSGYKDRQRILGRKVHDLLAQENSESGNARLIKNLDRLRESDPDKYDQALEKLGGRPEMERSPEDEAFEVLLDGRKKYFEARMELWRERLMMARDGTRMIDDDYELMSARIDEAGDSLLDVSEEFEGQFDDTEVLERPEVRSLNAFNRWTMQEYGLLFDKQMTDAVDRLAMNVADGKPTLLVGERGTAKTNLAKFVVRMANPDIATARATISVHGDITSDAFAGRMKYNQESRAWEFDPSKMVKAMDGGYPIILDEINTADQSVMMAIQDWLLLRPGKGLDSEIHQDENGATTHSAEPGFAVIATMNDYRNRQELDAATRDRFENSIIEIRYADVDPAEERPLSAVPINLWNLAVASACDEKGRLSSHIDPGQLEEFCRFAMLTERAMTLPTKSLSREEKNELIAKGTRATSAAIQESAPAMNDCVTPRTVVSVVEGVARGAGKTMEGEVDRVIGSLRGALSQASARTLWSLINPNLK